MLNRPLRLLTLATILALLTFLQSATAQNVLERLVTPGDVVEGHVKIEKNCTDCHKPFSKAAQDELCLDCHKKVAADIQKKEGFHWLSKDARTHGCAHCHTDHKGRKFDIIKLDKPTFNHAETDYPLIGAHISVVCEGCHFPGKLYRDAPLLCIDCHKAADPHKSALGEQCATCHDEKNWRITKPFDHDKTKYKLTGGHVTARCTACHSGERWKGVTQKCVDCHSQQDKHRSTYGLGCDKCHKTSSWKVINFDHDKDTKFPLLAKHQSTPCEKCHKQDPKIEKLATTCMPCHEKDDVHKGNLGKECQKCHNESGWKIGALFDHDKDTKFPLLDKHFTTPCGDCHKTKDYREAPKTCVGCHAKKDVHIGRLGPKCEDCHNAKLWKDWRYDHGKRARYPLTGKHAKIECYACHKTKHVEKVVTDRDCASCHRKDDTHKGAFGKDCGRCHTTTNFTSAFIRP
ncbi:MAG: cytochrome c3 family protein [Hyphomicrobium sp.]